MASDAGPEGHHWVLPAAAARDRDGGFVLFIVWFTDEPGDQIVTVARSDDGHRWRVGTERILSDLGMDLVHPNAIPTAALQRDDGSWVLFGWAAHASDPRRFSTWQASAPDPEGPWTLDQEVIVGPGPAGAWDSQMAQAGSVLRDGDEYTLWYEGEGPGSTIRGEIGLATSADGATWTKEAEPVIRRGICGQGTSLAVEQPQIETWSGGYAAAIGAVGPGESNLRVYGATSVDGRTWTCGSSVPLITTQAIPGSQGIHTLASVPLGGDRFQLIIESLAGNRSELWSAVVEVGG